MNENQQGKIIVYFEELQSLLQIVIYLNENNVDESAEFSVKYYDDENPYSFNITLCTLIYSCFVARPQKAHVYINYLKSINAKINQNDYQIFSQFLISLETQESNYLLEELIEQNLIEPKVVKSKKTLFFSHYQEREKFDINFPFVAQFIYNLEKLKKNDWELHKKYIKEGVNPIEIAKIIRNDEIEKLQEISSQTNFDFNQIIEPSLYERCSYINQKNVTLIDYAAFFSAIKCFKYLLMNGANLKNAGKYAVAGGNLEIIHLCEQNLIVFKNSYEAAIEFHKNDIFKYIFEKNLGVKDFTKYGIACVENCNFELLSYLMQKGMKINCQIIETAIVMGNLLLLKSLLEIQYLNINERDIYLSDLKNFKYLFEYFIIINGIHFYMIFDTTYVCV